MRKLIRPVVLIFAVALACLAVPSGPLLAQSNYQQQQQWQRQQEMQRQQQDQQRQQMQAQQRQQMQEQQRQQMQAQQRQQMQEQQRQQMQAQQRQQMQTQQQQQQRQQMQQQTAEQQRRQMQQQGKLGTVQPGTNKPTGMVISGGVAKMNRPLTPGEIQRGFTGRVTTDGRALIKFQGRIFTVPASRVSGLSAHLASQRQQQATPWTAQQKIVVNQRLKALTAANSNLPQRPSGSGAGGGGGGSDCTPPGSAKCQFNQAATRQGTAQVVYAPQIQSRIDAARNLRLSESGKSGNITVTIPLRFGVNDLVYGPSAGGALRKLQSAAGGKLLNDIDGSGLLPSKRPDQTVEDFSVQTLDKQVLNNNKIHFDLTHVEDINNVLNGTGEHADKITGVELRHIKSNWNRFKGNVKFYRNGEEVSAPW